MRNFALALGLSFVACGGGVDPMVTGVQPTLSSLYGDYLNKCASCHAPLAPGRTSTTEMTLDFSTAASAHATLTGGKAMGLVGNSAACNGVPFVQPTAAQTLLVAVLDAPTRAAFDLPATPKCDATAISDETVKVGAAPSDAFVVALKDWVAGGALNN